MDFNIIFYLAVFNTIVHYHNSFVGSVICNLIYYLVFIFKLDDLLYWILAGLFIKFFRSNDYKKTPTNTKISNEMYIIIKGHLKPVYFPFSELPGTQSPNDSDIEVPLNGLKTSWHDHIFPLIFWISLTLKLYGYSNMIILNFIVALSSLYANFNHEGTEPLMDICWSNFLILILSVMMNLQVENTLIYWGVYFGGAILFTIFKYLDQK